METTQQSAASGTEKNFDAVLDDIFVRVAHRVLRQKNCELEVGEKFNQGAGLFIFQHGFTETPFTASAQQDPEDKGRVNVVIESAGQTVSLIFEKAKDAFVRPGPTPVSVESSRRLTDFMLRR